MDSISGNPAIISTGGTGTWYIRCIPGMKLNSLFYGVRHGEVEESFHVERSD
jgi:hypothetical protein